VEWLYGKNPGTYSLTYCTSCNEGTYNYQGTCIEYCPDGYTEEGSDCKMISEPSLWMRYIQMVILYPLIFLSCVLSLVHCLPNEQTEKVPLI